MLKWETAVECITLVMHISFLTFDLSRHSDVIQDVPSYDSYDS
jgi:hypothetical protein